MKVFSRLLIAAVLACSCLFAGIQPASAQAMIAGLNGPAGVIQDPYGPTKITATYPVLTVDNDNDDACVTSTICNNNRYGVWVGIATYRIFGPFDPTVMPPVSIVQDFLNDQRYVDSTSYYLCPGQCVCLSARAPFCAPMAWHNWCCGKDWGYASCWGSEKDDCMFQTDIFVGCPIYNFACSDYYGYFSELMKQQGRLVGGNILADPVTTCWWLWGDDNW